MKKKFLLIMLASIYCFAVHAADGGEPRPERQRAEESSAAPVSNAEYDPLDHGFSPVINRKGKHYYYKGKASVYQVKAPNGDIIVQFRCPDCGAWLEGVVGRRGSNIANKVADLAYHHKNNSMNPCTGQSPAAAASQPKDEIVSPQQGMFDARQAEELNALLDQILLFSGQLPEYGEDDGFPPVNFNLEQAKALNEKVDEMLRRSGQLPDYGDDEDCDDDQ